MLKSIIQPRRKATARNAQLELGAVLGGDPVPDECLDGLVPLGDEIDGVLLLVDGGDGARPALDLLASLQSERDGKLQHVLQIRV